MGIELVETGPGEVILKMQVRPDMLNGVGWLQGGILVALADEAMVLALYPKFSSGEGIATISESTSFIKGTREGVIFAKGTVLRKGRRVAFMEGEVWTEEKKKRVLLSRTTAAFAVTSPL
ncbi:MAG: PaaI family thioesterase [Methanoregula sp.]